MPIHQPTLDAALAVLTKARTDLLTQAEAAESQRHTRVHGRVLRNQASGMSAAVVVLRDWVREAR